MQYILSSRLLTTRGGNVVVGLIAAVLAAIALLVYLNSYRDTVNAANRDVTVLVAKRLIPKGTPGTYIGTAELYAPTTFPDKNVAEGAIGSAASLRGRIALHDIYPGEQLRLVDFSVGTTNALPTELARNQRAIAIPIDGVRGLSGQLQAGDHVDVYVGLNVQGRAGSAGPIIKLLIGNALLLRVPGDRNDATGVAARNVILRVNYNQAAQLAWVADNGHLWFIARPSAGARTTPPSIVTADSVLFGIPPVTVARNINKLFGNSR